MKLKKPILSGLLSISLLLNLFIPVFAYNSKGSTPDRVTGSDEVQGVSTKYYGEDELQNPSSADTDVYATRSSTFIALIPKTIILSGSTGFGQYVVGAKGDVLAEDSITIEPDSYSLTLYRIDDHTKETPATVTQANTSVTGAQIEEVAPAYVTMEGSIQANGLKAGSWSTTMTFNIKHNDNQQKVFVITADNKADIGFNDTTTNLDIPSTVIDTASNEEIPVVAIDDRAFYDSDNLESVSIPSSVESIGSEAFANCDNLSNMVVDNAVKEIGTNAFKDVDNVEYSGPAEGSPWGALGVNVVYENFAVTSTNRAKVGYQGTENEELIIPATFYDKEEGKWYKVTSIEFNAFNGCTGLTSVIIPNSTISVEGNAFYGCSNLTSIVIPDSVKTLGKNVFRNCTNLTSVSLSNNITSLEETVFLGCTSLQSITLPESITSIGMAAFQSCESLSSITIPSSVTSIGNYAFQGSGLTQVTIPETVTSFGTYVFSRTPLESVVIPSSLNVINTGMFNNCTNLKSVVIPPTIKTINDAAFEYCEGLTSIEIPYSVEIIGNRAFAQCTGLSKLNVPRWVTSIGTQAFFNVTEVIYKGSASGEPWGANHVTTS